MEEFDEEKFFQEEELSSMKINDEITMEYIYNKLKEKVFSFDNIEIENLTNGIFRLNFKGKPLLEYIFEEPIKIEYKNKIKK